MSILSLPPTKMDGATRPSGTVAPEARRNHPVVLVLVLVYALFLAGYGLNVGELYRNEGLRALVGAEASRTGNWLVPTLHGEPFLTKPPGMTVAIALCSWPGGHVSEWTARLPSVLAAVASILLFHRFFRRQFGWLAGLVAAAILPSSLFWLDRAPSAEIDMLQLAWVTAAMLCFLRGLEIAEIGGKGDWLWWQSALLCVAGGFLTKWTAPAFFYLTVVPLLWWRGRLKLLLGRSHLASLSVAVGICLAWLATAATTVGWEVLFETVRREALQRLSPQHHYRCYPWSEVLSFPLVFLAANLPWSAFALATLHPRFAEPWDDRGRRVLQTLHCWLWINLLFWSVVPGHRPRHCLPLQPAIAGLAALVCLACLDGRLRAYRPRTILVGLLGLFLAIKLVHVQFRIPARDQGRHLRQSGDLLASLVPAGQTLYLRQLKDEGLLFYFGRPTRRLADPNQLPSRPFYCLLTAEEWQHWGGDKVLALSDGQGAPLVLARAP